MRKRRRMAQGGKRKGERRERAKNESYQGKYGKATRCPINKQPSVTYDKGRKFTLMNVPDTGPTARNQRERGNSLARGENTRYTRNIVSNWSYGVSNLSFVHSHLLCPLSLRPSLLASVQVTVELFPRWFLVDCFFRSSICWMEKLLN